MLGMFIAFLFGIILASIIYICELHKSVIGDLVIDESDSDGPFLFLELNRCKSVDELKKKKQVKLNVAQKNYISQK